jgi:hypothetical protein
MFSNFHFSFSFLSFPFFFSFFLSSFFISFFLFSFLLPWLHRPMPTPVSRTRPHLPHAHHHPVVEAETHRPSAAAVVLCQCLISHIKRDPPSLLVASLSLSRSLQMRSEAVDGNGGLAGSARWPRQHQSLAALGGGQVGQARWRDLPPLGVNVPWSLSRCGSVEKISAWFSR